MGHHPLSQEEDRPQVDGEDPVPLLGGDFGEPREARDADAVDQHVDPAESLPGACHDAVEVGQPGDVRRDEEGAIGALQPATSFPLSRSF